MSIQFVTKYNPARASLGIVANKSFSPADHLRFLLITLHFFEQVFCNYFLLNFKFKVKLLFYTTINTRNHI